MVFLVHFNSWLFTLEVREPNRSAFQVRLFAYRDWLCAYFAFSYSKCNAISHLARRSTEKQRGRQSVASQVLQKKIYTQNNNNNKKINKYICCLCHILVYLQCPKPVKKNLHLFRLCTGAMRMEHLWMSVVVDNIPHT